MELTTLSRGDVLGLADNGRVFAAGEEYAQTGMIFRFTVTPAGVSARVHGHYGDYTVTVTAAVKTHCTCPYEGTVCKHIIAVLLHYLESGYAQIGGIATGIPSALEQTLERMPDDDLRALVLRLAQDNADVRRAMLETIEIAPALLRAQPSDAKQVRALKKAVDKAFGELDGQGYEYEEGEVDIDLDFVFDAVQALHPHDQTDVLWHVVTQGNKYTGDYDLSTDFLERAIQSYGVAVARLELPSHENKFHLDTLMESLGWSMSERGDVSEAVFQALDTAASAPDEVWHVINTMERSGDGAVRDWAIRLRRRTGDEAGYLEARQANLHSEAQHLELADFFTEKGQAAQALTTLEAYVTSRNEPPGGVRFLASRPDPGTGRGEVLRRLIAHFTEVGDAANLCRILMAQAHQEGVTLALYQKVQVLAEPLGSWPECRDDLLKLSQGLERARLYLHERDWTRAIALARLPGTEERVQALIADAVKEAHPDEAIALYDALVQANIRLFNRTGYHAAARYASEVKRIYLSIVGDSEMAAQYIADIRAEYPRRPALREEFAGL